MSGGVLPGPDVAGILLLCKRSVVLGWRQRRLKGFGLPGGHLMEGETPFRAAVREMKEETGLSIEKRLSFFFRTDFVSAGNDEGMLLDDNFWRYKATIFIVRLERRVSLTVDEASPDGWSWYDLEALPIPLLPMARIGIERYLEGEEIKMRFRRRR